ncbi:MAG: electron transport complex subunit E [Candidatus Competibacterales bacterium]
MNPPLKPDTPKTAQGEPPTVGTAVKDGLWRHNPAAVQLLGLCPLLAVSTDVVNALGLGLATVGVMTASGFAVALVGPFLRPEVRLPTFVLIIATLVTAVELLLQAHWHSLHRSLGIFLPLIVTNCAIVARAEAFAARHRPLAAALDGLAMGTGFAAVLLLLGGMRELLGQGTLFARAHLILGDGARDWTLSVGAHYPGFLLALLPPGAFLSLGLLIAAKNAIDARRTADPGRRAPR